MPTLPVNIHSHFSMNTALVNLVDLAAVPTFVLGLDSRLVYANLAGAELLGLCPHLQQGIGWDEILHPDDKYTALSELNCILDGQSKYIQRSRRYLTNSRSYVWVSEVASVINDECGGAEYILLQAMDIDAEMSSGIAVRQSDARWNFALESAGQGVWEADRVNDTVYYSSTWKRIRGFAEDAVIDSSQEAWLQRVHPEDRIKVEEAIQRNNIGPSRNTFSYREMHQHGHYIWIESRGTPVAFLPDGRPSKIIGTDTDITDRINAEQLAQSNSKRLELALKVSGIGVFEADLKTGALAFDQRLYEIYGISPEKKQLSAFDFETALHVDDASEILAQINDAVQHQGSYSGRFRIMRPDGEVRTLLSHATYLKHSDGNHKFIGANWDISEDVALSDSLKAAKALAEKRNAELEQANARVKYQSSHDPLTGLHNRPYIVALLEENLHNKSKLVSILSINIDGFKKINGALGREAGDAVLIHVAKLISNAVGPECKIARTTGDEFVVSLELVDVDRLSAIACKVVGACAIPYAYQGHQCHFTVSVGIAIAHDGEKDANQFMAKAEAALDVAKRNGGGRFEFSTEALQVAINLVKKSADDVLAAVQNGQFVPYYQPIVDAKTMELVSVEALARWNHPDKGILGPNTFLKTAEDLGLIEQIDAMVLRQTVADMNSWRSAGIKVESASVNVSFKRLESGSLISSLSELNIAPGTISFELLESIFLDDVDEHLTHNIDALKERGISIDIDDFGTGHTSFVSLYRLHPRRLKIDRQIIAPIDQDEDKRKIVGSILEIARTLGIKVVAEGVETATHARLLKRMGCDCLQGFAFAKPMNADDFSSWAVEHSRSPG
ncbi:EAL domain-containing protein [uncultured Devosia sp.]|jgi:diguanylate cyclase (GGDEF)-like protein/PAS domain S-box-containing protein|uniref:EAL domain-containing protein n=1 Tax=uncultured Devosia sp. TaxID=211434 RepID=UPI0030EBEFD6